jgi:hypothetical protein
MDGRRVGDVVMMIAAQDHLDLCGEDVRGPPIHLLVQFFGGGGI